MPEVYRYRGDGEFEARTRPIKTYFGGATNITALKTELDKLGANLTEATLADYMQTAYMMDDDVQRAELLVATGQLSLNAAIERLNKAVLETVQRKLSSGIRAAHGQYLEQASAYLKGDTKKIFTYLGGGGSVAQYTRQDLGRHPGHIDMYRF